ncbi:hypothetical protein FHX37_0808 [Haloactinospora alba]|uniref:Uncharacterized protein n=1 Tax=Haloactinospora alba TaxID=405555 RepID=A0A543NGR0_9ACTN|nr:hypothetical protein FHX37_0808 [Haloactinospora alba]
MRRYRSKHRRSTPVLVVHHCGIRRRFWERRTTPTQRQGPDREETASSAKTVMLWQRVSAGSPTASSFVSLTWPRSLLSHHTPGNENAARAWTAVGYAYGFVVAGFGHGAPCRFRRVVVSLPLPGRCCSANVWFPCARESSLVMPGSLRPVRVCCAPLVWGFSSCEHRVLFRGGPPGCGVVTGDRTGVENANTAVFVVRKNVPGLFASFPVQGVTRRRGSVLRQDRCTVAVPIVVSVVRNSLTVLGTVFVAVCRCDE